MAQRRSLFCIAKCASTSKETEKAPYLVHPFDVWLQDAPSHTDAPFCWTASISEGGGIPIHKPAHALFDIGKIKRMEYVLGWPEVYRRDSWVTDPE